MTRANSDLTLPNSKLKQGMELIDSLSDDELNLLTDHVRDAYKTRLRRKNLEARASLRVGDRVKLTGKYKPAYLTGLVGVVTELRDTRVGVKLDCGPVGKFRSGTVIATPGGLQVL